MPRRMPERYGSQPTKSFSSGPGLSRFTVDAKESVIDKPVVLIAGALIEIAKEKING